MTVQTAEIIRHICGLYRLQEFDQFTCLSKNILAHIDSTPLIALIIGIVRDKSVEAVHSPTSRLSAYFFTYSLSGLKISTHTHTHQSDHVRCCDDSSSHSNQISREGIHLVEDFND